MTGCPIQHIIKRDGNLVPYDRDLIATAIFKAAASVGGSDRQQAEILAEQVEQTLQAAYGPHVAPTVEDVQDVVEQTLIKTGHASTARAYIIYRHERARAREARKDLVEVTDNIPYRKIYEVLRWNMDHGCATVDGINAIIENGKFNDLVQACTTRYDNEVREGADLVLERMPDVRVVIIAGPSSSGKTTTTIKMSERLREAGLKFKALTVDNYFFDLEMHPKDEFGDYDYETPQALDLERINQQIGELVAGKTVRTPNYDFKTGKRSLDVHEMHLADDEILLIDSLHGLYEDMTRSVPATNKFRTYIETLGQVRTESGVFMRWADNRLLRRMIRDSWHRNHAPMDTLTHWHYVRSSELKHIIPFIKSVDYLVNSALPFELPLLRNRLLSYFPEAMARFKSDSKRQDAYIRAKRIHDFLEPLADMSDDSAVPDTSLIREFIGGSVYEY